MHLFQEKFNIKRNSCKWKADYPGGEDQVNTHKVELVLFTSDLPFVEVSYAD